MDAESDTEPAESSECMSGLFFCEYGESEVLQRVRDFPRGEQAGDIPGVARFVDPGGVRGGRVEGVRVRALARIC
ncbi:MAG: hypothetical protein PHG64_13800 [Paludibacter sp.]|nr:hypothetical protein [Paludibacter sp.]